MVTLPFLHFDDENRFMTFLVNIQIDMELQNMTEEDRKLEEALEQEQRARKEQRMRREVLRRKKQKRRRIQIAARIGVLVFGLVLSALLVKGLIGLIHAHVSAQTSVQKVVQEQPDMDVELLTINEYSRPGTALEQVNAIVIHYTANPGTSAMQNRDYFEGLKDSHETSASSHFIIGLEGEIVQCIPTAEQSYASNDRNSDSIAIECCHEDETGKFNDATYDSLVATTAWLCGKFDLTTDDVIRHYDITGKMCPLYYVEHEDAWQQFLDDVDAYIDTNGVVVQDGDSE